MKLGIASSVFVNYPLEEAIRIAAEVGYDGIDIWGGRPHVYRQDYGPAELIQLRKRLEQSHLTVSSFMPAFFRYPHSLSSPNETVRQDTLAYLRQCVDNAVALGAGIVLLVPGRRLHGQTVEDARSRLLDSIDAVCRYAEPYDLRLGIEPANPMATDQVVTSGDALSLIRALGHASLGVVLDSGHLHLTKESPAEAMQTLGDRLLQFHVNDNDGLRQQNRIPGDGSFDFDGFMRLLEAADFDKFVSVELGWDYSLDPVPAIREAAERMRAYERNYAGQAKIKKYSTATDTKIHEGKL